MTAARRVLNQLFASTLRRCFADGFTGSGRTFRRVAGEWVHVVNVQGSRYGGQFGVNVAVHPLAIEPSAMPITTLRSEDVAESAGREQDVWVFFLQPRWA